MQRASDCVHHKNLEDFHEFLRAYTDIFIKNVDATKNFTYSKLKNIIKNEKLGILSGDKDSLVVLMQQEDYHMKLQIMISDGSRQGIYSPTFDITLSDLKIFLDIHHQNFKGKYDRYGDIM